MTLEALLALVPTVQRLEARVAELEARLAGNDKVDPDQLLNVDEAARILRVSSKTVRRMVWRGSLHSYGSNGAVRLRRGDLVRR